jgi:hypothetical protein
LKSPFSTAGRKVETRDCKRQHKARQKHLKPRVYIATSSGETIANRHQEQQSADQKYYSLNQIH